MDQQPLMALTNIEWTDKSWNPVTGCSKISEGCKNCYAEAMANRLKHILPKYEHGFKVAIHPGELNRPFTWKEPANVFVNSMSDLGHESIPWHFTNLIIDTMRRANWHTFQVLTKRPGLLMYNLVKHNVRMPENVWMGVTVENAASAERILTLVNMPVKHRFLSLEPLLSDIELGDLTGIELVIVGGESGPRARPMNPAWARSIRDQCLTQEIPFFFKQWGEWAPWDGKIVQLRDGKHVHWVNDQAQDYTGSAAQILHNNYTVSVRVGRSKAGRLLDGVDWGELPWNR